MSPRLPLLATLALGLLLPACKRGPSAPLAKPPELTAASYTKVSALDFAADVKLAHKASGGMRHNRKFLEVTGVVFYTTYDYLGNPIVRLAAVETPKDEPKPKGKGKKGKTSPVAADGLKETYAEGEYVECRFPKDKALDAVSLVPGQQATVRGVTAEGGATPTLTNAEFVSAGDVPAKSYTVAEIRKALGKERVIPDTLAGPIVVTGTIKSVEVDKDGIMHVFIAEDAAPGDLPPLQLRLTAWAGKDSPTYAAFVKSLAAGGTFRAYGKLGSNFAGDKFHLGPWRNSTLLLPK